MKHIQAISNLSYNVAYRYITLYHKSRVLNILYIGHLQQWYAMENNCVSTTKYTTLNRC